MFASREGVTILDSRGNLGERAQQDDAAEFLLARARHPFFRTRPAASSYQLYLGAPRPLLQMCRGTRALRVVVARRGYDPHTGHYAYST